MANQIKVTVSGRHGVGKTTIASIIRNALRKEGFRDIRFEEDSLISGTDLDVRAQSLAGSELEITIDTVAVARDGIGTTELLAVGPAGMLTKDQLT